MRYCVLNIKGTKRNADKIRAGQNYSESSLLPQNDSLSKIFYHAVQLMLGFSEEEKPGDKVQEHPETLTLS